MIRIAIILLLVLFANTGQLAQAKDFDAFELTIPELQAAMESGDVTSEELVRGYLQRIEAFDKRGPRLNAMIYLNPDAVKDARALDRERVAKGARGPLHGIPVVLKDNYDTFDMPTTASAVVLAGFIPPDDGYQVRKLREAGAVFIGKTNMHEFARGIETISSAGGQTRNPYDPRRNPGGSSGGTAVAVTANYAAVGMGSDTCGSIRVPAAYANLFGLRVTQGLSSRDGIIPLSHTQDVGGPLARSVIDLVTVLDTTVGADPADTQSSAAEGHVPDSYRKFLDKEALQGARLGLLKAYLKTSTPFGEVTKVIREAVDALAGSGVEIVEVEIPGLDELLRSSGVINMEFGFDLERYLRQSGADVQTLEEILASGRYHAALQARYRSSTGLQEGSEKYQERLARRPEIARLLTTALAEHRLDALVYPTIRIKPQITGEPQYSSLCQLAAHSGLPAITIPAGFTPDGMPVGIELLANPFEEGRLLALAYAYEQSARPRRPPARTPSLVSDVLTYTFELQSTRVRGRLHLERPTQMLHYSIRVPGVKDRDIVDIKLHIGVEGRNGPVIELLGRERKGRVLINNAYLDDLLQGGLYLVVYTRDSPQGVVRGQIEQS
ncbi:MAG: amidase family protein [Xanthomonadales bacterium]|nr:amidase family protein [Xanthomonadales bacterium]